MLQQIAPVDPSNPQAMQEYLAEAQSLAESNGLNKWGINTGQAINVADKLIDRNQAVAKLQGSNTQTNLANKETQGKQTLNELANAIRANGGTNDDIIRAAAVAGVPINVNDYVLSDQAKAVGVAKTVSDSRNQLAQSQNALKELYAQIQANNGYASAEQQTELARHLASIQGILRSAGGGVGKSQGAMTNSAMSSTPNSSAPYAEAINTYTPTINNYANQYGVSPSTVSAIIETESSWNPNAVGDSGKAVGFMQMHPEAASEVNLKDRKNPEEAIRGGTEYFSKQLKAFNGNETHALMAYNWGAGNVRDYLAGKKELPASVAEYVQKIQSRKANYGGSIPQNNTALPSNVKPSDYIVEKNKSATRNQSLAPKLANTVAPALAKHGLSWEVTSGGQAALGSGGKRVGSTAHDHGNSGDGDIFDKKTGRKLSFNNPEDQKRIAAFVEDLAASGITGIGGHTEYMGDGRLHIGFQNNARVWGGTNGKAGNSNTYGWLTEAFNRGRGVAGRSGGGNGSFDVSSYINRLQTNTGSPNTNENTQELLAALRGRIGATNTLLEGSPQIDLNSAALPDFIGSSTGSAQDALKMFAPEAQFIQDDHEATMNAIGSSTNARIADMNESLANLVNNEGVMSDLDTNLARAREQARASGSNKIPFSAVFGDSEKRKKEGIALLRSAGYTSESLAQLDPPTQKLVVKTLIDYMNKNENHKGLNKAKLDNHKRDFIKFPDPVSEPDKPIISGKNKTSLQKMLHDNRAEDIAAWKKEENGVEKVFKKLPFFTPAKERQRNIISVQEQMIKITEQVLKENPKSYNNTFKNEDFSKAIAKAEEIYKSTLGLRDIHDYEDLDGFTNKLQNPGLFAKSLKQALDEIKDERIEEQSKLLNDVTQMSFKDTLDQALRGSINNMIGSNPYK